MRLTVVVIKDVGSTKILLPETQSEIRPPALGSDAQTIFLEPSAGFAAETIEQVDEFTIEIEVKFLQMNKLSFVKIAKKSSSSASAIEPDPLNIFCEYQDPVVPLFETESSLQVFDDEFEPSTKNCPPVLATSFDGKVSPFLNHPALFALQIWVGPLGEY